MKNLLLSLITLFLLLPPSTSQAFTEMDVDCKKKCQITLTIKMWTDASKAHQRQIKQAVQKYWNPKKPLKYHKCNVKVVIKLITAKQRPRKASDSYFQVLGKDPKGGGATSQKGVSGNKGFTPTAKSHVSITTLPNGKLKLETVAHELGHVMGIDDPQPTKKWDRDGIKNRHIDSIFKKVTYTTASGTYGWGKDAECCKKCNPPKKFGFFWGDKKQMGLLAILVAVLLFTFFRIRKSRTQRNAQTNSNTSETNNSEKLSD